MATTEARPLAPTAAELEVALGEVDAVLAAVPAGDYRERLELLRDELADGAVSEGAEELDRLIELALQSGRLRAIYGPGGEAAATRLYRRLPSRARPRRERRRGERRARRPRGTDARGRLAHRPRPRRLRSLARRRRQGADRPARPVGRPRALGGCLTCPSSGTTWRASTSRAAACSSSVAAGSRTRRSPGCSSAAPTSPSSRRGSATTCARSPSPGCRGPTRRPTSTAGTSSSPRPRSSPSTPRSRGTPRRARSSATSSTTRRSAPSSCPRSTGRARSRSPSRPAAPHPPSRSGSATGSPPRSGPTHADLARQLRALRPWAKVSLPTYDDRKAYFERLVERALS